MLAAYQRRASSPRMSRSAQLAVLAPTENIKAAPIGDSELFELSRRAMANMIPSTGVRGRLVKSMVCERRRGHRLGGLLLAAAPFGIAACGGDGSSRARPGEGHAGAGGSSAAAGGALGWAGGGARAAGGTAGPGGAQSATGGSAGSAGTRGASGAPQRAGGDGGTNTPLGAPVESCGAYENPAGASGPSCPDGIYRGDVTIAQKSDLALVS